MQRSKPSAALPEVRITKAASHTRFSSLSLRKKKKKKENKNCTSTFESPGGAERQTSHIPKGSHSTSRFHKTPAIFKNKISPLLSPKTHAFQTCWERKPNSETHANGTYAVARFQVCQTNSHKDFSLCCQSVQRAISKVASYH